jgi:hypothetical protein
MPVVAEEVQELALLKMIMEIEHTPNLRILNQHNSKLKHQHKLLPPLALRTLMQPVRS